MNAPLPIRPDAFEHPAVRPTDWRAALRLLAAAALFGAIVGSAGGSF